MSPRAAAEFTKQWPSLERRLTSFLRGKRVAPADIDDLLQEVAMRLLSVWHKVDRSKEPWPLVVTIALNLLRDRSRKRVFEVLGDLPDVATADAADAGIARVELGEVFRAMDKLTPLQRDALLRALEPSRAEVAATASDKMLRLRARRRLASVVGRASAGFALRFRRTTDALHALVAKSDGIVQALACATCLFVTTAGGVSLVPNLGTASADASPLVVETSVASASSTDAVTVFDYATGDAASLGPDRSTAAAGKPVSGTTRGGSAAVGGDAATAGGSGKLPLPTNAPLPGSGSLPAPGGPGGPDQPAHPPAPPQVAADVPHGQPPVSPPVPISGEEVVDEVSGTLTKATG